MDVKFINLSILAFICNASIVCGQPGPIQNFQRKEMDSAFVCQLPGEPATSGYDIKEYFSKHLRYPRKAVRNNIEGKVFVTFTINEDGRISDVTLGKGIDPACDKEALRLISNMPPWKPGRYKGKPAKSSYTMPVVFKLEQ